MYFRFRDNPASSFGDDPLSHHRSEVTRLFSGPLYFDRSVQAAAKNNANQATNVGSGYGARATEIGASLIPGLERDANNPTGYDPTTKNRMLVESQEAVGGSNAGLEGEANLAAARTRNAGGFASALDEAARIKNRQLSGNALRVENESARVAQQKQAQARGELAGIYGTDVSAQLKSMGLSDEDLRTALEAGKSGWLQQAEGVVGTVADAAKAFRPRG